MHNALRRICTFPLGDGGSLRWLAEFPLLLTLSPWQPGLSLPPLRRQSVDGCSFSCPPPSASWPFQGLLRFLPPCPARATAVPSAVAPPRRPGQERRSAPPPAQAAVPYIRVPTPAAQTLALWSWRRGRRC